MKRKRSFDKSDNVKAIKINDHQYIEYPQICENKNIKENTQIIKTLNDNILQLKYLQSLLH